MDAPRPVPSCRRSPGTCSPRRRGILGARVVHVLILDGAGGCGPSMPTPFTPNPSDRSSVRSRNGSKPPSTPANPEIDNDPNKPTESVATPNPEPPTVISANRQKSSAFDATVGAALAGKRLG